MATHGRRLRAMPANGSEAFCHATPPWTCPRAAGGLQRSAASVIRPAASKGLRVRPDSVAGASRAMPYGKARVRLSKGGGSAGWPFHQPAGEIGRSSARTEAASGNRAARGAPAGVRAGAAAAVLLSMDDVAACRRCHTIESLFRASSGLDPRAAESGIARRATAADCRPAAGAPGPIGGAAQRTPASLAGGQPRPARSGVASSRRAERNPIGDHWSRRRRRAPPVACRPQFRQLAAVARVALKKRKRKRLIAGS